MRHEADTAITRMTSWPLAIAIGLKNTASSNQRSSMTQETCQNGVAQFESINDYLNFMGGVDDYAVVWSRSFTNPVDSWDWHDLRKHMDDTFEEYCKKYTSRHFILVEK